MLNYFRDAIPDGNFVAYIKDGSGASLFQMLDGAICCNNHIDRVTRDGFQEFMLRRHYNRWSPLPDDFNFWFLKRN